VRNIYNHEIELRRLTIHNASKNRFRKKLEKVKYRGYLVETLADGRQVVITKPGGKSSYGRPRREDIMVWIRNPADDTLWLISHNDIFEDIKSKGRENKWQTIRLISAFERVFKGENAGGVLRRWKHTFIVGESPELLLKAYKWIWGQEDCNYPTGEGRAMSMKRIRRYKRLLRRLLANR